MARYSLARLDFLVILSLLFSPLSYVSATATPRWPAKTPPVVRATPDWFSARPDPNVAGAAKGVWLPAIRPVHRDLADVGDRGLWLWVDFYDDQLLSDWAFSSFEDFSADVYHEGKLDFCLTCDSADWPYYSDCKLHEDLNDGQDYSARWYGGLLVPETGSFTFWLEGGASDPWNICGDDADDGARMFIDGEVVAQYDWNYGPQVPSNTVTLQAGLHYLAVDYQQRWIDQATLRVSWSGPGFPKEVIPALDADALPDDAGYGGECPFSNCDSSHNEEGGPVNTRSGNYIYRVRDLEMQTLAGPLSFERTYIAQATDVYTNGLLGYGWAFNHDRRLIFYGDDGGEQGTVILRGKSGSSLRFSQSWENPLEFQAWPGIRAEMTAITETVFCDQGFEDVIASFVITAADQSRWTFAQRDGEYSCFTPPSLLSAYRDPQGNVLTYTYNLTHHWLSRVEDASGRYLAFDVGCLDESGDEDKGQCLSDTRRLLAVSDHSGRAVRFGYDLASGDLTVVTDTRGFTWTYAYSGTTHWLQEARDPHGQVIERNWYDRAGRVITQSDGLGQLITFEYAHHSGQTTVTFTLGQTPFGQAHDTQVDQYDARNLWTGQSRQGEGSSYDYDANFNRQSYSDANGRSTQYAWSADGYDLQAVTDALGQATRLVWNERHYLTGLVNAQGYSTTYEYDELNNPITITDALGGMTVNRYDERGNLIQTTRDGAYTTTYAYDRFGQRIATTDTLDLVTRYGYDQLGRTAAVATPQGITRYAYDAAGNTVAITRGYTTTVPNPNPLLYNRVTRYEFDALGRQTRVTETVPLPGGGVEQRVTYTWYDAVGQVLRVTRNYRPGYPQNFRNQYNLTTRYAYDAVGNQSTVTDTLGHVNRTFYDTWDRPITTVVNYVDGTYDPAGPDEDILTVYGYDAVGNPVTTTDTLGRVTVKEYDRLNRVLTTTVNYTHTTPSPTMTMTPDPNTYNLATSYDYDAVGNLVTTTNPLGA